MVFCNLALVARANYLVTRDTDLLDLADIGSVDGNRLRALHSHLTILDPVAFLRAMVT